MKCSFRFFLIFHRAENRKKGFKVLWMKGRGLVWIKSRWDAGGNKLVSDNFSQSFPEGIVTIPIVTNYAPNSVLYRISLIKWNIN